MSFVILACLVGVATVLLMYRRAVEERAIRWQLYCLRDELRALAYDDVKLKHSALFRRLDHNITMHCATLSDVSIWSLLPVFIIDKDGREKVDARQRQLAPDLRKNPAVKKLYDNSVRLMIRHLLWRHMFLTGVAAVSLVGIFLAFSCARWASERIVSGALEPVVQPRRAHAFAR
jgi:hypothetical protein